jgi:myo-inositol 2-dehydrogenase / D-chiro-inositol 1-dehydrogenase
VTFFSTERHPNPETEFDPPCLSEIRCLLVGAGAWGQLVARTLRQVPGLCLAGVVDQSFESGRIAAEQLDSVAYGSLEEALDDRVDAAIVAVPNFLHQQVAMTVLRSGKHLLLEKPMALTLAEAQTIVDRAEDSGCVVMLDHIQRYFALFKDIRALLVAGRLGTPLGLSIQRRDSLKRTKSWLRERRFVGGLLFQSACHEFDLARWLLGEEAVEITATSAPQNIATELDYPDTIASQLRFPSGAFAQFWNCMSDPVVGYDGIVLGTEGSVRFDLYAASMEFCEKGRKPERRSWVPSDRWAPWAWMSTGGIAQGEAEALTGLLDDFRIAITTNSAPAVTAVDGMRAIEIAQAGYLSIANGEPVRLPLPHSSAASRAYLSDQAVRDGRGCLSTLTFTRGHSTRITIPGSPRWPAFNCPHPRLRTVM